MKLCQVVKPATRVRKLRLEFSETCLVFWYNNKIQSFFSPKKSASCAPANSQSGSLCTGSETSHFQIVESDKEEAGASDETCED